MQTIDLIIIGSGPAGVSTALHLLQCDPRWANRMLLLEKAVHPRPKLCGGAITRLGLEVLLNLRFKVPPPIAHAQVDDVRFLYRGRTVHVRGQPQLLIFHRAELDAYLADQAQRRGAVILQNEPVTEIAIDPEGVTVHGRRDTYRARIVVGADGSKGLTRKLVNGHAGKARVARLLEASQPAPESAPVFAERFALFDFNPVQDDLQGYFWEFPSRVEGQPIFNRGVYDARFVPARRRADLPGTLSHQLGAHGQEPGQAQIKGHPLHWFSPRSRYSRPRLLLAGDAAGVDGLFGEGIAPALAYGQIAAQAVQEAFIREDFSFSDYRRRVLRSKLGEYLLVRWSVAWWSYHFGQLPWFMHLVWTLGMAVSSLWPQPKPLYPTAIHRPLNEI
jgi:flavin-dependent dehydrogenase